MKKYVFRQWNLLYIKCNNYILHTKHKQQHVTSNHPLTAYDLKSDLLEKLFQQQIPDVMACYLQLILMLVFHWHLMALKESESVISSLLVVEQFEVELTMVNYSKTVLALFLRKTDW